MSNQQLPNHFIPRDQELVEITHALRNHNTVLITGPAGIGKTSLVKYYELANPLDYEHILFFQGIEFDFDESKLDLLSNIPPLGEERLVIIDGFDEILSNDVKNKILRLVKEGRKYDIKTIITSRDYGAKDVLINNSYHIPLLGLGSHQAIQLLRKILQSSDVNEDIITQFKILADKLDNNPLLLSLSLELLNRKTVTPRDILNLVNNNLHYKNEIIDSFSESKLILPEVPKIITDTRLINTSLLEKVGRNPKMMHQLTSRQFEELVGELFEKEGYNVNLTQATRDGGKDLLIVEQKRIGNFIIYVECKNYSSNNPIGVRLVRELYGTVVADRATAGVLVASSYFSNPAIEFKEQVKSQLSLIDYYDLIEWINDKSNIHI